MNSKQRFDAVCKFRKPDKFPVDYLADIETDTKLKRYIGIESESELLDYLGCDFYYMSCRDISQNEGFMNCYKGNKLTTTDMERVCPFGIRWKRGAYNSKFSVDKAISGPLEGISCSKDIINYKWPKPNDFDFSNLIGESENQSERIIIGGLWTGIMGDAYRMYGFERFLLDMAMNPDIVKGLVNKITDVYLELNNKYFDQVKGKMDIWYFGNDFGSQNGMLFSPNMWVEYFYENLKKLCDLAKSYNFKVMMHSCGSISEIIPYLIDVGIDILDPIQITAKGMEPENLADRFGESIIFHGGIDTQNVLPKGTKKEVIDHCNMIMKLLGSHGGYIFAPSQLLGEDIPIENIIEMYKAADINQE